MKNDRPHDKKFVPFVSWSLIKKAVRKAIIESAQPDNLANEAYYLQHYCTVIITEKVQLS